MAVSRSRCVAAITRTSTGIVSLPPSRCKHFLLQHAQQLDLRAGRHVADFIQENRAVIGLLEPADAPQFGAGERAAFVAEQFAFQQRFGNGGAIDGDERRVARGRCAGKWRARSVPCRCRFRRESAR